MAALFGIHLVERGAVSPDALLDALEEQRRSRPLFGRVAMVARFLTVKEVMRVLDAQATQPKPFGEIAIELGLLDAEAVARILYLQQRSTPRLGEVLVRRGALSPERLGAEVASYRDIYRSDEDDYDAEAM